MVSISAFGIACAGLTAVLAASASAALQASEQRLPVSHSINVEIAGLRDSRGIVRICLTERAAAFPDCGPGAPTASIGARAGSVTHTFANVPDGEYAIAAFHDANGNGRLDTTLGIPREGFAFSRNPPLRPRAPKFAESRFILRGETSQQLKMRYIL